MAYRSIKCRPLAVSTTELIWPGWRLKAASSNSFCMSPLPKYPRSPRLRADEQSDSVRASSPRVMLPLLIFCSWALIIS